MLLNLEFFFITIKLSINSYQISS
jgi:Insect cuticle protein/Pupal cuticle protein C1